MKQIFKSILGILVISSSILFSSEFIEINYDGSADIYGFQFNYIGEGELIGASGGSAAAAGFTVSTGNNTVLGFSFSGSYIEGGDGILTIIEVDGEIGCIDNIILSGIGGSNLIANVDCNSFTYEEDIEIGGCNDIIACNYNPDATVNNGTCEYASDNFDCDGDCNTDIDCLGVCGGAAVNDECGVCNGDGSSCNGQESNTSIITYNTNVDIYGFQFRVDNVDLTGVYGGNAENAGFTVSYSAASGMVVGFSFSGSNITAGEGVLLNLDYNGDPDDLCISNLILSGEGGSSLDADIINCNSINYQECIDVDNDMICDDSDDCIGSLDECGVCNGDGIADGECDCEGNSLDECGICSGPGAIYECGCVEIEDGECDCSGNVLDCNGECGGNAIIDECGACNGDGIADGACDCEGNVLDCYGVCGGDSIADECGVCEGNGVSCGANGTLTLSYQEINAGSIELNYESDVDIAGFQFNISGALLSSVYGGLAQSTGFTINHSVDAVVAFSLTGQNIPQGSGVLLNLDYSSISSELCITEPIFGNSEGDPILIINENCADIDFTEVLGCMDSDACNYNEVANTSDDSCYYSELFYDCDGNCIAGIDCEGECGGSLFIDECGICGGDGYSCLSCENLSEFDCFQSPFCDWEYELIQCAGLSEIECEEASGCNWDNGGGSTGGGGGGYPNNPPSCEGGWGELNESCIELACNFLGQEECSLDMDCEWYDNEGYIDCDDLNQQECNSIHGCDWNDGGGSSSGGGGGYPSDPPTCEGGTVLIDESICIQTGGCLEDAENCPEWNDDPGSYQFVATMNILVLLEGFIISETGDFLAAFGEDGNIRGIGYPVVPSFGEYEGEFIYEMQVRSNSEGDLLSFKYYDFSEDLIYEGLSDYTFINNDISGDLMDPYILDIGIYGCTTSIATNYNSDATIDDGSCEYPPLGNLSLENFNYQNNTLEVHLNCEYPVSDFEFTIEGLNILGFSSGAASSAGFEISIDNNTVIGSATSEDYIASDAGHLLTIDFDSYSDSICFEESQITTYVGIVYEAVLGDCIVPGCLDEQSCSYNAIATDSDNSCLYLDCAGVCGGSAENCPNWSVDAGSFEFTSTLTGLVSNEGVQLSGSGDILAAFDGSGEVRGIATELIPGFGPYAGTVLYELQVYSNAAGESLSFQYYDASEDLVLPIGLNYTFVINDIYGDVINPVDFYIQTDVDLVIDLIAGWNWISFNVDVEDASVGALLSDLGDAAAFINSQSSGTSQNYGDYGWYGGLAELSSSEMYLLNMTSPATLTITGAPIDVSTRPIDLITGWNWLGYLPQNPGDVGTAFAGLGDAALFVNSQSSGTSQNYGDYGWYGGLSTLEPGSGYLLNMNAPGTLVYPSFDAMSRLEDNKGEVELVDTISDWDFNYADHEFVGTITASIESRNGSDGDLLGVFVDGECRGISERMYFPFSDSYVYIVQVYSSVADGEEMTFKYYDSMNDAIVLYEEKVAFTNNMIVGDGFNTLALNRELSDNVQPVEFGLSDAYPNPFNPVTSFSYTVLEDGMVNISVYDVNGRIVAELVNNYQSVGSYPVSWDAQELSSGVYMLSMIAGEYSSIQKIMLIK